MADVYLARDEELRRPVALKLMAEGLAADRSFRQRFLRESRLAARLSHPNVVSVYDAGEDGGRPYIVMEYVEGETLADVLARRGSLPADEVVEIALQVCAGLEHAHAAGLVHRDVKPQNLLVRADGTVKIADFGIARAAESTQLTQAGTVLGTGAYLAPEQAAGEEVTPATDVYSLGVVLYELLTGKTPHAYESLAELLRKRQDEPVVPVADLAPGVPRRLEDAVMRCLALNPAYRPRSAAEVAAELRADSRSEAPTRPLARPAPERRRRWPIAAAVAVLAALALAAALIATSGGGSKPAAPPPVQPVPHGSTPSEQARNLAEWARAHARRG